MTPTRRSCSDLVETERITTCSSCRHSHVPARHARNQQTTDISSLREVFYGASPIAEDVLVACLRVFKCHFTQVYGMTETTGAICALRAEDHDPDGPRRHLLRSAGKALAGCGAAHRRPRVGSRLPQAR